MQSNFALTSVNNVADWSEERSQLGEIKREPEPKPYMGACVMGCYRSIEEQTETMVSLRLPSKANWIMTALIRIIDLDHARRASGWWQQEEGLAPVDVQCKSIVADTTQWRRTLNHTCSKSAELRSSKMSQRENMFTTVPLGSQKQDCSNLEDQWPGPTAGIWYCYHSSSYLFSSRIEDLYWHIHT